MHKKLIVIFLILFGSLSLSGCLEDFQVALHEPGVYMGPEDDLLAKSQSGALADRLTGQTDR